jgi:uncharacterized protein YrrD
MPKKLRKIERLEVVTLAEGRQLGRPADILVDPAQHRVAAIVLSFGPVAETSVIVPAEDIPSFESDTLAVGSLAALKVAAHDEAALQLLTRGLRLKGRPVLSAQGEQLGRIRAALVDARGVVTEYRVRKGVLGYLRPALRVDPAGLRTSGGEMAVVSGPGSDPPGDREHERLEDRGGS